MIHKMILTGELSWEKFRDSLIKKLKSCKEEKDLLFFIKVLSFSCSNSEEEMQEKRRLVGIPET